MLNRETGSTARTTTVRSAQASDASQLAALCGQLGYPSTAAETAERLREIQRDPSHEIFVAEHPDGSLAGYLDVLVLCTMESGRRAEMAGLVVDQASRSLGLGELLVQHAEAWAREQGCRTIGLRSNVIRERAHSFYQRLGYQIIKTQHAFRKAL